MKSSLLLMAVVAALGLSTAQAEESPFVFGGGVGQARLKADGEEVTTKAWKVFGGYRVVEGFNIEAAYSDYGKVSARVGDVSASIAPTVMQLSAVSQLPVTDNVNLYARAGVNQWEANIKAAVGDLGVDVTPSGTEFAWGVGIGSTWNNVLVRLEYEAAPMNLIDSSLISLSVAWKPGGREDRRTTRDEHPPSPAPADTRGVRVFN